MPSSEAPFEVFSGNGDFQQTGTSHFSNKDEHLANGVFLLDDDQQESCMLAGLSPVCRKGNGHQ